jgi:hypothetical protein
MSCEDRGCLLTAETTHVVDGRFPVRHRFVDVGGVDDWIATNATEEVDSPRRP